MVSINVGKLFPVTEGSEDTVSSVPKPKPEPWAIDETPIEEDIPEAKVPDKISSTATINTLEPALRHPLSKRFHNILKELGELHDRKQKDYGTEDDPFANVRGAEEFGVPSYTGAFLAMNDCMQRIKAFSKNGNLEFESVDNALRDLAVYSIIGLVLYEESEGKLDGNN